MSSCAIGLPRADVPVILENPNGFEVVANDPNPTIFTLVPSAPFAAGNTVTLSSSDSADTFAKASGANAGTVSAGSIVLTPSNGEFLFKFNKKSTGTSTITCTNNFGGTDPAPLPIVAPSNAQDKLRVEFDDFLADQR